MATLPSEADVDELRALVDGATREWAKALLHHRAVQYTHSHTKASDDAAAAPPGMPDAADVAEVRAALAAATRPWVRDFLEDTVLQDLDLYNTAPKRTTARNHTVGHMLAGAPVRRRTGVPLPLHSTPLYFHHPVWSRAVAARPADGVVTEFLSATAPDPTESGLIFISGPPGCGKSRLASSALKATTNNTEYRVVAWLDASTPAACVVSLTSLSASLRLLSSPDDTDSSVARSLVWTLESHAELQPWLLVFDGADTAEALKTVSLHIPMSGGVSVVTSRGDWKIQSHAESNSGADVIDYSLLADLKAGLTAAREVDCHVVVDELLSPEEAGRVFVAGGRASSMDVRRSISGLSLGGASDLTAMLASNSSNYSSTSVDAGDDEELTRSHSFSDEGEKDDGEDSDNTDDGESETTPLVSPFSINSEGTAPVSVPLPNRTTTGGMMATTPPTMSRTPPTRTTLSPHPSADLSPAVRQRTERELKEAEPLLNQLAASPLAVSLAGVLVGRGHFVDDVAKAFGAGEGEGDEQWSHDECIQRAWGAVKTLELSHSTAGAAAVCVLECMCVLAPTRVPTSVLLRWAGPELGRDVDTEPALKDGIELLQRLCLLHRSSHKGHVDVCESVRVAVRHSLTQARLTRIVNGAAGALRCNLHYREDAERGSGWRDAVELALHTAAIVHAVENDLHNNYTLVGSELLLQAGTVVLRQIGDVALAEKVLNIGASLCRVPSQTAEFDNVLSVLHHLKNNTAESVGAAERALVNTEAARGSDHITVGHAYTNFGTCLIAHGAYDESVHALEKGLSILRVGMADALVAKGRSQNELSTEQSAEAAANVQKGLEIYLACLGSDHEKVAETYAVLGDIKMDGGDSAGAIEAYGTSVKIAEQKYGTDIRVDKYKRSLEHAQMGTGRLQRTALPEFHTR